MALEQEQINDSEYCQFKRDILKLTGIDLNAYKERQMKRRIQTLCNKYGFLKLHDFYMDLSKNPNRRKDFMNYLTINVSEFYRNPSQWEILKEKVIPELIKKNKGTLKIWSAACSTGDEPYTICMLMKEEFPGVSFEILATDLDDLVIAFAKDGIYTYKSIQNLPVSYQKKYFTKDAKECYTISRDIINKVQFKQHNLLENNYGRGFDLIVCRNVLIYFTEEAKLEVFKRFHGALRPDGYLFIGNTEQILQARAIHFESMHSFFYRKILE